MYLTYSLAHSLSLGDARKFRKRVLKHRDIGAAEEACRQFETRSMRDATIAFLSIENPELSSELHRLTQASDESNSIREMEPFYHLRLTMEASSLLKWMKNNGYYGSTVAEAYLALWQYEPVLHAQMSVALHDKEFLDKNTDYVISRANWMTAVRLALGARATTARGSANAPERVASYEFSKFYMTVLLHLYSILKYTVEVAKPVSPIHRDDTTEYLRRIDSLVGQVASLREENERLVNRDRKELTGLVAPLEKAVSDRDKRIEELEEELRLLREIQDTISQQESVTAQLLELPTDDVLFVGGHQTLRCKLQERFPRWTFIGVEEMAKITTSDKLVFLYTDYISHKMTNLVRKNATMKPLYCHGTNMERLERSMREAYTLHKETNV